MPQDFFTRDAVAAFLDRAVDLGPHRGGASFADVTADVTALGLPPGTPVVIALSNGRQLLAHWFAVLLTGGVPVAVSPATASARLAGIADRVGAGAVVAARVEGVAARLDRPVVRQVGDVQAVVLRPARPPQPEGTALMLTSGTSGLYSACLHRAESLVRNATRHATAVGLRADDTVLVSLPLFYSYALVAQAFAALVTGARLVISGPPFSPAAYPGLLTEHGITSSSITPTIARLLLHRGERLPTDLRVLTVGGDHLAGRHVAALRAELPDTELYITYGLTEAGPRVSTFAAHREPAARFGSVGLPLPGVTTELRDVVDGVGELLVRTDTALLAKLGDSGGRALVSPGVVATGDRFRVDDDGYLHHVGRISDFVVIRGEKVSLAAVREHVQSLPGVVGCTTACLDGYDGGYDLDVRLDGEQHDTERVRRAVLSFLLPAERPRTLTVGPADLAALRK